GGAESRLPSVGARRVDVAPQNSTGLENRHAHPLPAQRSVRSDSKVPTAGPPAGALLPRLPDHRLDRSAPRSGESPPRRRLEQSQPVSGSQPASPEKHDIGRLTTLGLGL